MSKHIWDNSYSFVAIKTDYTARFAKQLNEYIKNENIQDFFESKDDHMKDAPKILCIVDRMSAHFNDCLPKVYYYENLTDKYEAKSWFDAKNVDQITSVLDVLQPLADDGIIILSNCRFSAAMNFLGILKKMQYCAMYKIDGINILIDDKIGNIACITMDTESG
jgi:endonuclease III-like uncharacterized protein